MHPVEYNIYAVGVDLKLARAQDKVELMEESLRVVTYGYLKHTCKLEKKEKELQDVKATVDKYKSQVRFVELDCA